MAQLKERAARAVARTPLLRSPRVRKALLKARRRQRRYTRRAYERLGSERLSRPSLHQIDRKLAPFLPAGPGFFVEAGAYDGFEQSNTYHLERFRGWRGVLVEPIPELYRECLAERPASQVFNCALVPGGHPEPTVTMRYGGLMSLVATGSDLAGDHAELGTQFGWDETYEVEVPARTLSDVLEEAGAPRDIDLLSLDVEGFEDRALAGLDLERHAPRLIVVEMHEPDAMRPRVEAVLGERYEFEAELSPLDFLYRRCTT